MWDRASQEDAQTGRPAQPSPTGCPVLPQALEYSRRSRVPDRTSLLWLHQVSSLHAEAEYGHLLIYHLLRQVRYFFRYLPEVMVP